MVHLLTSNQDFVAAQRAGGPGRIVAGNLRIAVGDQAFDVHPASQLLFCCAHRFVVGSTSESDDGKTSANALLNKDAFVGRFGNALLTHFLRHHKSHLALAVVGFASMKTGVVMDTFCLPSLVP